VCKHQNAQRLNFVNGCANTQLNQEGDFEMKHVIGSVTLEAIDTYVRVTVRNIGGVDAPPVVRVTKRECPEALEVAQLLSEIRGYWPDYSHLCLCSRAAEDARNNKTELCLG